MKGEVDKMIQERMAAIMTRMQRLLSPLHFLHQPHYFFPSLSKGYKYDFDD